MKSRFLVLCPTLAVLLAGCAKEPVVEPIVDDSGLIPLNIDGSINQIQTKVNAAGFVDKDALGLFAVNYSEENTVAGTLADNGNPVPIDMLYNMAPSTIPMNSDEYTSLVFNANAMATTGGRRDQIVPIKLKSILFFYLMIFSECKGKALFGLLQKVKLKSV